MLKTILVALIVLFLAPSALAHEEVEKVVIHMREQGYDPQNLEVVVGTTVVFENVSSVNMWPASNIHPTHSIYPEFDPKKAVLPGGSWEFNFNKSGKYRYHDHLYPTITGEITVKGDSVTSTQKKEISLSEKLNTLWDNTKIWFVKLYFRLNPKGLEDSLSEKSMVEVAEHDPEKLTYFLKVVGFKKVTEELVEDSGGGR